MGLLIKLDSTITVNSGSTSHAPISTAGLTNDDSPYLLHILSPSNVTYIIPAGSTDTYSALVVSSSYEAKQYGPVWISGSLAGVPSLYFPSVSGSAVVSFSQVLSE